MATALSYEDLKKSARHLENEIDLKLVAFSKLGAGLRNTNNNNTNTNPNNNNSNKSIEKVPLLSSDDNDTFESMSLEIEGLLGRLRGLNECMKEQPVSGAVMLHTLKRHQDILNDLSRDFAKTSAQHDVRRERQELLGTTKSGGDGINNRRDLCLKENQHIHSADHLVSEQISIAMETREHLISQRHTFKKLQTRFNDISNKYPIINSLIQRIHLKKRRDTIILGVVISTCTILALLYLFH